ncbi:MAG: nitroreductase family protein [Propionibacteriaceae bacterium]|jgi:nitroreductase|nr:nitroreductase family protein [Propionibacteriaceae bacterium]
MSTLDELKQRTSVRIFEDRAIDAQARDEILACAFAAPTAGNQMLYTILQIDDQSIKDRLAVLCDNQPFIAHAPLVLVFLADCRRWYDAYTAAGCQPRDPGVGDLILACEDTMVAAQNAVTAAQHLGIGSCYIGDIVENHDDVVALLNLDKWVFPVALVVFGYPTEQQKRRAKPIRFAAEHIVLHDTYRRLSEEELRAMYTERGEDFDTFVPATCARKYMSDFSAEMSRSVAEYLKAYS